jgi:2-amino-4-hydroxy-6-hydroxymethyldihydropteridine diphosphokinase
VEREVAYIGIGSNLGDRAGHCRRAVDEIRRFSDTLVVRLSSLYDTEPVEYPEQESFVNGVVAVRTGLPPLELLSACQKLEQRLGRKRTLRYGPRTIDLDILLYGQRTMETAELILPHPKLHLRRFVLVPLIEIAPEVVHPVLHQTGAEFLNELKDNYRVRRLPPSFLTLD